MHAVLYSRFAGDKYVGNRSDWQDKNPQAEPYLDGQGLPEAGHYFEQLVFGGINESLPFTEGPCPPPLLQAMRTWPYARASEYWLPANPNSSYIKDGAKTRVYIIPSTWSSKLCSEAFWNDPQYPRKSDNFFHNSRRFRTTAPIKNKRTLDCSQPDVVYRRNEPYLYPEENTLIDDWNAQKALLESIQGPWFGQDFAQWGTSPWCDLKQRQGLRDFADGFAKRDHEKCAAIAEYYAYLAPWNRGYEAFRDTMPQNGDELGDVSNNYLWHAVGLLMLASLPLRHEQLVLKTWPTQWIMELMPSRAAAAAGHHQTIYTHPDLPPPKERAINGSVFFDSTRPGIPPLRGFEQMHYMILLSNMVKLIINLDGYIFKKFMDSINTARKNIMKERQQLAKDYPGKAHTSRWLSKWHFELPPYDPMVSQWDPGFKAWRPIEVDFSSN
ncbi:hypothetical protein F5Y08DRAFT_348996 [Xylaria arbuscula]|nr:hypothetical protein F5Y08DRAFT_348996 [Xylaria arbuscula]